MSDELHSIEGGVFRGAYEDRPRQVRITRGEQIEAGSRPEITTLLVRRFLDAGFKFCLTDDGEGFGLTETVSRRAMPNGDVIFTEERK